MQCLICLVVNEQKLFQIEYIHYNISDHSFQCEFQFLINTCVCLKKVNLNKHCNKDTCACSNANKHFKQKLFGTTRGTLLQLDVTNCSRPDLVGLVQQFEVTEIKGHKRRKFIDRKNNRKRSKKTLNVGTKVKISKKKLYFFFSKPLQYTQGHPLTQLEKSPDL